MILKWGGVLGGDKRGNKKTLSEMKDYLAVYLQKAQEYFNHKSNLSNSYKINVNGEEKALIMNSGFTKIYIHCYVMNLLYMMVGLVPH